MPVFVNRGTPNLRFQSFLDGLSARLDRVGRRRAPLSREGNRTLSSGRDRVMMPWPCLEVSCPTWGGMSGGPVYDSNGLLVGILSTSIEAGDVAGPSFISLVWPALATQFEGGWPEAMFPRPCKLLDLDARLCSIERRDAIRAVADQMTGGPRIEYGVWER